jgi:glycolate oxidase iron-sulfur subunit
MDPKLLADCVHCGFCLPTCPTYLLWHEEMDSPRGRISLMEAQVDGTARLSPTVVTHFDRCLGCLACVPACPSGVRYDRLIELTRARVEEEVRRPLRERVVRAALFGLVPRRRLLGAALALAPLGRRLPLPGGLRPMADLAPPWRSRERPPEVVPAAGEPVARLGLLLGCVQSVVFGDVNAATARVLAAAGYEVVVPRGQGCCGALAAHGGRLEEGVGRAERLVAALAAAGAETVAVNAAGCGSHLKEHASGVPVRDVHELLAASPLRRPLRELPLRVAYQDACHLGHAQGVRDEPRAALRAIPGLELVEPAEQAICCGSAGTYNVLQPEAARELGDRKARHVIDAAPDVYAAANPGCLVQVSTALRRAGRPLPSQHPVELVDASLRGLTATEAVAGARR